MAVRETAPVSAIDTSLLTSNQRYEVRQHHLLLARPVIGERLAETARGRRPAWTRGG
jgi:hypothetical protein